MRSVTRFFSFTFLNDTLIDRGILILPAARQPVNEISRISEGSMHGADHTHCQFRPRGFCGGRGDVVY